MKYEDIPPIWTAIKGWTDYEDLYDLWAAKLKDGDVVVELGSYLGRSALYLASLIVQSGKHVKIVCVDLWPDEMFEQFRCNTMQAGFASVIVPIRMDSVEAASIVRSDLAAVFVDADHSYEGCLRDIHAWYPKVRAGGMIAGHDFGGESFPGVTKAVGEVFGDRAKPISFQCWIVDPV